MASLASFPFGFPVTVAKPLKALLITYFMLAESNNIVNRLHHHVHRSYIYIYLENSDQVVFCEMFIGNSLSCVWES